QKLCRDYEATLDLLLEKLGERNLDIAVEIASLPEHIRGFEQVREAHIEKVRAKHEELLAGTRRAAPRASHAPSRCGPRAPARSRGCARADSRSRPLCPGCARRASRAADRAWPRSRGTAS